MRAKCVVLSVLNQVTQCDAPSSDSGDCHRSVVRSLIAPITSHGVRREPSVEMRMHLLSEAFQYSKTAVVVALCNDLGNPFPASI